MININDTKFNNLSLQRYPLNHNEKLRAWDAADEYLLNTLNESTIIKATDNVLVFNDSFGAVCLNIQQNHQVQSITVMTDSINSKNGIINNCNNNNIDIDLIHIFNSLDEHINVYNHVIIKTPKSLDFLIFFLTKLRPFISSDCNIMIAGMVKHLPKNLWTVLEQQMGPTQTSLTKKKAKIITVKVEKNTTTNKYPITFQQNKFTIYNHAAVFSKQSLDIGTRFLLENLPSLSNINDIIDLGCGNGVVGLNLAKQYPNAQITLTDESYMAIASAQLTIINNLESIDNIKFSVNNCLDGFKNNSVDLIVCNPPFHQSQNIGIQIALTMFKQSQKTLRKNGYLIVVANRHLPYFTHLKRTYKEVVNLSSNHKFNIYLLRK